VNAYFDRRHRTIENDRDLFVAQLLIKGQYQNVSLWFRQFLDSAQHVREYFSILDAHGGAWCRIYPFG
jgi:hypothetical protein